MAAVTAWSICALQLVRWYVTTLKPKEAANMNRQKIVTIE